MTENIRQTLLLVVAGVLAVFAMTAALTTEKGSDVKHKAIQPEQDVSVRVIVDDGAVIMFSDCETKQEPDGTITIKARSKGNL